MTRRPRTREPLTPARVAAFTASELSGGRAFAVAGGVVTLLGIVFLFVLAANRGWIGPVARVSIGAVASLAVLATGLALRVRFGRLQASLAATGTGIAGGYATLAAATIIYGFLPSWGALLLAAGIASVGSAVALRWESQVVAGLSFVGAAAAPALVALDDEILAAGTAFVVVVLAASFAAAAPRRWLWLAIAVGAVSVAQVIWLTAASAREDGGAIAVAAAAALVLLAGAVAWQASSRAEGLDSLAATLALASGGLLLGALVALLPVDRDAGIALTLAALVYVVVARATWRRWADLASVTGAVALLLAGVSTSLLLSERSLTVVFAAEAAALAVLAWRVALPRFQLASLAYLALAILHALAIDVPTDRPPGDLPTGATAGTYAIAGAAAIAGTLVLRARRDPPSVGLLSSLEPLWNGLVSSRGSLRAFLYGLTVAGAVAGTTAALSGRTLTLALLAGAVALGVAAFGLGERRLQAAALMVLGVASVHALAVEAQLDTLALPRGLDAVAPVPSLAALAVAWAALAQLARFSDRGIAFLGALEGVERSVAALRVHARLLQAALLAGAVWLGVWAVGLLLVRASYEPGQVGATALWAMTATIAAAVAARRRSVGLVLLALPPMLFVFLKAALFDWDQLSDGWAATALIVTAAALLLLGFLARYAAAEEPVHVELASLATAVVAIVCALTAVDRLAPERTRVLGGAALAIALVVGALAFAPFRAWRAGRPEPWLRDLATFYWGAGLVTLGFAERDLLAGDAAQTVALWAATAALVGVAAGPLEELRLWLAANAGGSVATVACVALVTIPSRLFSSSPHPGAGLWALVVCIATLVCIAAVGPADLARPRTWDFVAALVLALFALSLGVLEMAERVSGASVETDFQRGHTAVSALWGALALAVFVAGIVKAEHLLQRLGLALFGLALAKLFLYDLRNLSSITRALSFLAVGAILLAAAFFTERMIHGGGRGGPRTA